MLWNVRQNKTNFSWVLEGNVFWKKFYTLAEITQDCYSLLEYLQTLLGAKFKKVPGKRTSKNFVFYLLKDEQKNETEPVWSQQRKVTRKNQFVTWNRKKAQRHKKAKYEFNHGHDKITADSQNVENDKNKNQIETENKTAAKSDSKGKKLYRPIKIVSRRNRSRWKNSPCCKAFPQINAFEKFLGSIIDHFCERSVDLMDGDFFIKTNTLVFE